MYDMGNTWFLGIANYLLGCVGFMHNFPYKAYNLINSCFSHSSPSISLYYNTLIHIVGDTMDSSTSLNIHDIVYKDNTNGKDELKDNKSDIQSEEMIEHSTSIEYFGFQPHCDITIDKNVVNTNSRGDWIKIGQNPLQAWNLAWWFLIVYEKILDGVHVWIFDFLAILAIFRGGHYQKSLNCE